MRRDLRLSDHPALTAAAQSCQWLVAVHVIADRELEPRRNQPGMATGVPQLGPHQLRCTYTVRSVSTTMPTATSTSIGLYICRRWLAASSCIAAFAMAVTATHAVHTVIGSDALNIIACMIAGHAALLQP